MNSSYEQYGSDSADGSEPGKGSDDGSESDKGLDGSPWKQHGPDNGLDEQYGSETANEQTAKKIRKLTKQRRWHCSDANCIRRFYDTERHLLRKHRNGILPRFIQCYGIECRYCNLKMSKYYLNSYFKSLPINRFILNAKIVHFRAIFPLYLSLFLQIFRSKISYNISKDPEYL